MKIERVPAKPVCLGELPPGTVFKRAGEYPSWGTSSKSGLMMVVKLHPDLRIECKVVTSEGPTASGVAYIDLESGTLWGMTPADAREVKVVDCTLCA